MNKIISENKKKILQQILLLNNEKIIFITHMLPVLIVANILSKMHIA